MKQRGFTLIELMIVLAIIGIVVSIALPMLLGKTSVDTNSNISWGFNGMTETRCIDGYKFVVGEQGQARQIMDELGRGVRCGNPDPGKMGSFGGR